MLDSVPLANRVCRRMPLRQDELLRRNGYQGVRFGLLARVCTYKNGKSNETSE